MTSPARSRILGDTEESAPTAWELGGPNTEPIHAVVIVHAADDRALDLVFASEMLRLERTNGGVMPHAGADQRGYRPSADTEPFGFRDGIAQPSIVGLAGHGSPTGEFILGYPNHYDLIPPSPLVPRLLDPQANSAVAR